MKSIIMNVKVEIKFSSNPEKQNYDEMYNAAKSITNNYDRIIIYQPKQLPRRLPEKKSNHQRIRMDCQIETNHDPSLSLDSPARVWLGLWSW